MGQITVSILKKCAFRGAVQHFSNTYTYRSPGLNPSTTIAQDAIIDEIVNKEKAFHSTAVTFVKARMWSSGGSRAENVMLREKSLSGTGTAPTVTAFDPERAVLVQWEAGKDNRGRTVRLKKWYHVNGSFGNIAIAASHLTQQASFSAADRDAIANQADGLTRVGVSPEVWGLTAESGRERTGDGKPRAHAWLEHHQLGEEWRGR